MQFKYLPLVVEISLNSFGQSFVQMQKVELALSERVFFLQMVMKMTNLILFGDPGSSFKVLYFQCLRQTLMWNALNIEGSD